MKKKITVICNDLNGGSIKRRINAEIVTKNLCFHGEISGIENTKQSKTEFTVTHIPTGRSIATGIPFFKFENGKVEEFCTAFEKAFGKRTAKLNEPPTREDVKIWKDNGLKELRDKLY